MRCCQLSDPVLPSLRLLKCYQPGKDSNPEVAAAPDAKSDAGIKLTIRASKFIGNGFGGGNQHGVGVDETGPGAVLVDVLGSVFRANGADGLSLYERGGGDVSVTLAGSKFLENGYNNPDDPDDGFDVDEHGGGNVILVVTDSRFNDNFDDGIDIDERGPGSITSDLDNVTASRNLDQGITYDERKSGGVAGRPKRWPTPSIHLPARAGRRAPVRWPLEPTRRQRQRSRSHSPDTSPPYALDASIGRKLFSSREDRA